MSSAIAYFPDGATRFVAYPVLPTEVGVVQTLYEYRDVRRFGADPTGAVGSTIAFQNCTTSAIAAGYAEIIAPAGNYLVSGTVFSVTSATARIRFRGAGSKKTILTMAPGFGTATPLFSIVGASGARVADCELSGFSIVGQADNTSDGIAISADYTNGLHITDVFVDSVRNSALVLSRAWDFHAYKMRTYGCGVDGTGTVVDVGQAVSAGNDNSNTVRFVDCTIERNYGIGVRLRNGSDCEFLGGKIHGRATTDSDPTDSKELVWVDSWLQANVIGTLLTQCRTGNTSGAVRLTGSNVSTLGLLGCTFSVIGADDTYCVYFDSTEVDSKLSVIGSTFRDTRAVTKYGYVGAGTGAHAVQWLGNNSVTATGMWLSDNRATTQETSNTPGWHSVDGTRVLRGRMTGWSTWTGTRNRAALDSGTATLAQVAQTLAALIDDLHNTNGHGLIGT